MQQSPYIPISQHLYAAWAKDHPEAGQDPGFWGWRQAWVEDAFAERVPPQYVDQVEVDGQPWVMVFADDKLHLARLADDHLEVVLMGALVGGEYRESVGDQLRMEFSHPRLQELKIATPLVFEGSQEKLKSIRGLLRQWAETPAAGPSA
jgi:hypothetical protein